jgi:hypothetical protein
MNELIEIKSNKNCLKLDEILNKTLETHNDRIIIKN